MADLEDALKKLDRLTQEEARLALAELLRITHNVRDEVKIVDGKVERVENKVEDVGNKVGDKVDGVGEKVEEVGDKVQVVIDGARACPINCQTILTSTLADGKRASVAAQETKLVIQHAANDIDEIKCSWPPDLANAYAYSYSQGTSLYNSYGPGSLPLIRPPITTLRERPITTGRQRGSFKARS